MALAKSHSLLKQFQQYVDQSQIEQANKTLCELKICLTSLTSLPPGGTPSATADEECMVACQTMEYACLLSVKKKDMNSFECHIAQLKPYYAMGQLQPSGVKSALCYSILGMNLLHLLVDNRLAEFHSELELIPEDGRSNECIAFAVQLEQYLMEGSYSKVLAARASCPKQFTFFMEGLVDRVRDSIAECSEAAYKSLAISEAQKLMIFSTEQQLMSYIKVKKPDWNVTDGNIVFQNVMKAVSSQDIPSLKLISETLLYANELERIV